jgi:hypothetical protein
MDSIIRNARGRSPELASVHVQGWLWNLWPGRWEQGLALYTPQGTYQTEVPGVSPGEANAATNLRPGTCDRPSDTDLHQTRGPRTQAPSPHGHASLGRVGTVPHGGNLSRDTRVRISPTQAQPMGHQTRRDQEGICAALTNLNDEPAAHDPGHSLSSGTRYPTQSTARGPWLPLARPPNW